MKQTQEIMDTGRVSALDGLRDKSLRVAAFCRSATSELQWTYYSAFVSSFLNWTFVGCYGSQNNIDKTEWCLGGLPQLIAGCKAGEIGLIVTKSSFTLKRNVADCLSLVRELKSLDSPVGIFFEMEDFYTLRDNSDIFFSLLQATAEWESENKGKSIGCVFPPLETNILKRARKAKGMTLQQVADKAGINIRQYQRFERGDRSLLNASFQITMAVCFALDIDPDRLKDNHSMFLLDRRRKHGVKE